MKTYGSDTVELDRERLFVGVSEYEVVDDGTVLVAYGLGASVGLAIYDPQNGVGGLARAMLPRRSDGVSTSDGKYVDAAVEATLREAVATGANYAGLEGYVVGGASLIDLADLPSETSERNVAVARETLGQFDISVEGEAVGGDQGRTVEFNTATGEVRVTTAPGPEPTILRAGDRSE